jgi:hypothetical protein
MIAVAIWVVFGIGLFVFVVLRWLELELELKCFDNFRFGNSGAKLRT